MSVLDEQFANYDDDYNGPDTTVTTTPKPISRRHGRKTINPDKPRLVQLQFEVRNGLSQAYVIALNPGSINTQIATCGVTRTHADGKKHTYAYAGDLGFHLEQDDDGDPLSNGIYGSNVGEILNSSIRPLARFLPMLRSGSYTVRGCAVDDSDFRTNILGHRYAEEGAEDGSPRTTLKIIPDTGTDLLAFRKEIESGEQFNLSRIVVNAIEANSQAPLPNIQIIDQGITIDNNSKQKIWSLAEFDNKFALKSNIIEVNFNKDGVPAVKLDNYSAFLLKIPALAGIGTAFKFNVYLERI